jgi:hypothetical protein
MTNKTLNSYYRAASFTPVEPEKITKRSAGLSLGAFLDLLTKSIEISRAIPDTGSISQKDLGKVRAMLGIL